MNEIREEVLRNVFVTSQRRRKYSRLLILPFLCILFSKIVLASAPTGQPPGTLQTAEEKIEQELVSAKTKKAAAVVAEAIIRNVYSDEIINGETYLQFIGAINTAVQKELESKNIGMRVVEFQTDQICRETLLKIIKETDNKTLTSNTVPDQIGNYYQESDIDMVIVILIRSKRGTKQPYPLFSREGTLTTFSLDPSQTYLKAAIFDTKANCFIWFNQVFERKDVSKPGCLEKLIHKVFEKLPHKKE